jgi:hypothetical protein
MSRYHKKATIGASSRPPSTTYKSKFHLLTEWDLDDGVGVVVAKEFVGTVDAVDNDVLGTGAFEALSANAAADWASVGFTAKTPPLLHSPPASSKNLLRRLQQGLSLV